MLHTTKGCGIQYMDAGLAKRHAGGIGDDKLEETYASIQTKLDAQLARTDRLIAEAE